MPPQVQHTALWVATVCECVSRAAAAALSKMTETAEVASVLKSSAVSVLFFGSFFSNFFARGTILVISLLRLHERRFQVHIT